MMLGYNRHLWAYATPTAHDNTVPLERTSEDELKNGDGATLTYYYYSDADTGSDEVLDDAMSGYVVKRILKINSALFHIRDCWTNN
jgi:hypothetical protein